NKTQEEIAKALGVSQQAISESLPRLLAKLKKILGKK
ncbi:MAG: helix-turn-helix domain-containing protein, partial [Christensenellaceae bacterium]